MVRDLNRRLGISLSIFAHSIRFRFGAFGLNVVPTVKNIVTNIHENMRIIVIRL